MPKKNKKISQADNERIEQYLQLFAKESPQIREEIASSLPSYNMLLSLHAESFEEFALLPIAREQNLPYDAPLFDFKDVKPVCPRCSEKNSIRKSGINSYICNKCNKKYAANHDSISTGTNCNSLTWMKILYCILQFYPMKQTCAYCGISSNTYYAIRNRLFHAMEILLQEMKLYGHIQVDNTFVKISYKGMSLAENDYPEGSIFDTVEFLPRFARSRGGHYNYKEKNENHICIFTAIDEFGHSLTRFVSIGVPTASLLANAVGKDKILLTVPYTDPFLLFQNKSAKVESAAGDRSLMISDGEAAIRYFAKTIDIDFESHVYRRNGVQMKLSPDANNIQRVNQLHKKLKKFLANANYVSSKYLPGYLVLFEFIENTGASSEAIGKLFEILAQPGLKMPSTYYQEKFVVPNYLIQQKDKNNPLKNFSENQLLAFYLYDKRLQDKKADLSCMAVNEISQITGYAPSSIRRIYKNFSATGYTELIRHHFQSNKKIKEESNKRFHITPELLAIYDEYAIFRTIPSSQRSTIKIFIENISLKYKINFKQSTFIWTMNRIQESGLRPPLPDFNLTTPKETMLRCLEFLEKYEKLTKELTLKHGKKPYVDEIYNVLSEQTGLAPDTLKSYLVKARRYRREQFEIQEK